MKLMLAVNEVLDKQRCIVAYLDSFSLARDLRQARLESLPLASLGDFVRELEFATGEELRPFFGRTLLPSVLDRAFKGEL